jgi:hypothetical protein
LNNGELEKVHFIIDLLILTQADMSHSALGKLFKTLLINNTSMNMLKDQGLAEDLDFDYLKIYVLKTNSLNKPYYIILL